MLKNPLSALTGGSRNEKVHQIGIEPTSVAPEAAALSTELLVHAESKIHQMKKSVKSFVKSFDFYIWL